MLLGELTGISDRRTDKGEVASVIFRQSSQKDYIVFCFSFNKGFLPFSKQEFIPKLRQDFRHAVIKNFP